MTWQRRAACRASPHLFDLDLDAPETPKERLHRHAAARVICRRCPVSTECLIDAIEDPTTQGVRAGYIYSKGYAA